MKFYIEIFSKSDEALDAYIATNLTPEQVAEAYDEHPAGVFELTPEMADHFGLQSLDFESKDYFLTAAREHVDEAYEYRGEKFYPPPMFLPDIFDANPVRPRTNDS
jgi:hypothetical protein